MSNPTPESAPPPSSPPAPPSNSTSPPPTAASPPPALPAQAPPPASPTSPSTTSPPTASASPPPDFTPAPSSSTLLPPSTPVPSGSPPALPSPPSPPVRGNFPPTPSGSGRYPAAPRGGGSSSDEGSSEVSTGLVVGIAIGGVVILSVFSLLFICCRRKKKRRNHGPVDYYPPPPPPMGYKGQPKIIHRDIKAANILLDFNFEAKVADFGLAKLTSDVNTHVSTRVMGTFGYLAPEYAASGKLTEKSDVFSYGVMLLELITGRRPVDSSQTYIDDSLVGWARPQLTRALEDKKFDSLIDPRIGNDYNHNEVARVVASAAACVRRSARRRPRMSQVVRALEGDVSLSDLNEGIRPGQSTVYSSYGSSDYDASQYNEDMAKFRKLALASQEYGSTGQYSNPTSEYGLYLSGSSSEGQQTREMEMSSTKKERRGFS